MFLFVPCTVPCTFCVPCKQEGPTTPSRQMPHRTASPFDFTGWVVTKSGPRWIYKTCWSGSRLYAPIGESEAAPSARWLSFASGKKEPSATTLKLLCAADEVARVYKAMKTSSFGCKRLFSAYQQPTGMYGRQLTCTNIKERHLTQTHSQKHGDN